MALWRWCAFRNRTGEMLPGSVTQSARSAPSDGGGHPRVVNAAGVTRWPQSLRLSPRLPPGLRGRPESGRGAGRSPQLGPAGLLSTAGLWRLRGFQRRLRGKSRRAGVVLVCAEGACALGVRLLPRQLAASRVHLPGLSAHVRVEFAPSLRSLTRVSVPGCCLLGARASQALHTPSLLCVPAVSPAWRLPPTFAVGGVLRRAPWPPPR